MGKISFNEGKLSCIAIILSFLIILLPVSSASQINNTNVSQSKSNISQKESPKEIRNSSIPPAPSLKVEITDKLGKAKGNFRVNKIIDKKFHLTISKGDNHITIKKTPSLSISAKIDRIPSNERLVTNVVAVKEDVDFESATLVLQKRRPVKEILYCPKFDYEDFTCPKWVSTNIPFIEDRDMVTFTVSHFSAYAGGSTNSELYIWDSGDEGLYPEEDETVYFYANYTNATTNASITGATCQIRFNETGSWGSYSNMTNSSGKYQYSRTFDTARSYTWYVLCDGSSQGYDNLNATDEVDILVDSEYSGDYVSRGDLSYDDNGNLVQGADNYYEYNELNRLIRVRNGSAVGDIIEEYAYDESGDRVWKIEYFGDGTNQTTYYWDDDYIEVVNSSGTFSFKYYHDLDGNLLGREDPDSKKYYYHPDHLGSTTLITNESGDVVEETRYLPFGEVSFSSSNEDKFLYEAKEKDLTGLHYFGARYYDNYMRRFTQSDTLLPDVYDPQQLNRYAFEKNNPVRYYDSTGNSVEGAIESIIQIGWGILGVATGATITATSSGFGVAVGTTLMLSGFLEASAGLVRLIGSSQNDIEGDIVIRDQTNLVKSISATTDTILSGIKGDNPLDNKEKTEKLNTAEEVVAIGLDIGFQPTLPNILMSGAELYSGSLDLLNHALKNKNSGLMSSGGCKINCNFRGPPGSKVRGREGITIIDEDGNRIDIPNEDID